MTKRGDERKNIANSAELLVRFEVMRVLAENPHRSVMLPSYRQLAEKFHFSERTIANEIKRLIGEGWIRGRRGVGVFTNPTGHQLYPGKSHRIIGIAAHDSPCFSYDYNNWALMLYPGLAVTPRIGFPRNVNLFCRSVEQSYLELRNLNLDALIWSLPSKESAPCLIKVADSGMPVVTLINQVEGIPCVGIDFMQAGRDIGHMLLKENKTNLLWCLPDEYIEQKIAGVHEVFAEAGVKNATEKIIRHPGDFEAEFEKILSSGNLPDAIYLRNSFLHYCEASFRRYGFDLYKDVVTIADWSYVRQQPNFSGICHRYPYEKLSEEAANLIECMLNGQSITSTPSLLLNLEITRC